MLLRSASKKSLKESSGDQKTSKHMSANSSEHKSDTEDSDPENKNTIEELKKALHATKATNGLLREKIKKLTELLKEAMSLELKDAVLAIPVFSGDKKELEAFINTCDIYHELISAENQPNLLKIIKSKITGEAFTKISPILTTETWVQIKKKLKDKHFKKVSFEFAQEDLNNVVQLQNESIEQYGYKVRKKLRALNEAIKNITETAEEKAILFKMNEKLAISKFEQNLRDQNIRILVSATTKTTLDETITYALQKELLEKSKNKSNCSICGMNNHTASTCRRRNTNYSNKNNNFQKNQSQQRNDNKEEASTSQQANKDANKNNGYANSSNNFNRNKPFNNGSRFSNNYNRYPFPRNPNNYQNENNRNTHTNNPKREEDKTIREVLLEETPYQVKHIQAQGEGTQMTFDIKNNEIRIHFSNSLTEEPLIFCIDTGAQVSILKPNKILDAKINTQNKINITGVAESAKLQSMGTVHPTLYISSDKSISHDFHILNKNFNINTDGILGNDFLIKTNAKLDMANKTMTIFDPNIPEPNKSTKVLQVDNDYSEYFHAINEYQEYQCKRVNTVKTTKKSPNPNFYDNMSNDFFTRNNYDESIINNVSQNDIPIFFPNQEIFPRSPYHENSKPPINNPQERCEIILKKTNLNGLNQKQIATLRILFTEFSDAFYIDGDKLHTTDVYEHSFKLKPDTDTVFVRQYRIPETQKPEITRQVNELLQKQIIEKSTSRFNSPVLLVKKRAEENKEANFRLVIDYRKLNEATIGQSYPMPLIDEITDNLHDSEIFTILDVYSAFHQILLRKDCRHYTAFSTSNDHYQFRCTPFGLQSSPIAWLYTINAVLRDFTNRNVFWYMDDIIVHAQNESSNIQLVRKILKKLIEHNLKLKPEKCSFLQSNVKFLGYKISKNGLEIDGDKMKCIKNYPRPKTPQDVMRFCGFTNFYRKWVEDFAKVAKPLYNLCKKDNKFEWTVECEEAFEKLKLALITPPVLAFPRFDLDFVLCTDASIISCSGILANRDGKDERPIQYFSRTLNDAQTRYSTIELELLAIIWSVEWFRSYLFGRKFYIYTDHKPLVFLFNNKNMSARLHRWRLTLMEYQFEVIHREGRSNYGPDALSRVDTEQDTPNKTVFMVKTRSAGSNIQSPTDDTYEPGSDKTKFYYIEERNSTIIFDPSFDHIFFLLNKINGRIHKQIQHKLKKIIKLDDMRPGELLLSDENRSFTLIPQFLRTDSQILDMEKTLRLVVTYAEAHNYANIALNIDFSDSRSYFEFKNLIRTYFSPTNIKITLYLNKIIEITDTDDISATLHNYHNTLLGGHASFDRMFNTIRKHYKWNNMASDIKKFVKNCTNCQKNKIYRHNKQPLIITSVPIVCFDTIFMDHVGKINPVINNNAYILTIICDLSKYAIAIAVPDNGAETTAKNLVEKVFLKFGFPSKIVSDNHKSFTGETLKKISKILKINQVFTSPFTPSSNVVERFHKTLNTYFRTFIGQNPNRWPDMLDFATWAYNNTVHSSTNFSPFELVYGRNMELPRSITRATPSYTYDNYADELKNNLAVSWQIATENLIRRKNQNKKYYDQVHKATDLDLQVGDDVFMLKTNREHKFDEVYEGPYKIIEITGPNSVKIKRRGKIIRAHKNKLKKCTGDPQDFLLN